MQAVGGFRHAASDSERTHRTTVHLYDCPQQDKANKELLRKVVEDYKVGGLLFSGGLMQNQVMLTNEAQRMAEVPLMITFDGEWGWLCAFAVLRTFRETWCWAAYRTIH